jgi:hypothetical protein
LRLPSGRTFVVPLGFLVLLVFCGSAYTYWRWSRNDRITQPIAFNHRAHITNAQLQCSDCHPYYSKGARSGLPSADVCMTCHSDALTKSPEEAKLREESQRGNPPVFRKLFHLPPHVYYSHRRHVVLGKLECVQCHGQIADTVTPPTSPLVRISMDFCTGCHTQLKVTNDCKACHR